MLFFSMFFNARSHTAHFHSSLVFKPLHCSSINFKMHLFIYFGLGSLSLIELFLIRCQYNFFKKAITFHHDEFKKFLLSFFTFYINNNDLPAVHGSRNCTIYFLKKIPAVTHAIYSAFIKLVFKKKFFLAYEMIKPGT